MQMCFVHILIVKAFCTLAKFVCENISIVTQNICIGQGKHSIDCCVLLLLAFSSQNFAK